MDALNILRVTGRSMSQDFASVSACSASASRSIFFLLTVFQFPLSCRESVDDVILNLKGSLSPRSESRVPGPVSGAIPIVIWVVPCQSVLEPVKLIDVPWLFLQAFQLERCVGLCQRAFLQGTGTLL